MDERTTERHMCIKRTVGYAALGLWLGAACFGFPGVLRADDSGALGLAYTADALVAERYMGLALETLHAGDVKDAKRLAMVATLMDRALEHAPEDAEAWLLRGYGRDRSNAREAACDLRDIA